MVRCRYAGEARSIAATANGLIVHKRGDGRVGGMARLIGPDGHPAGEDSPSKNSSRTAKASDDGPSWFPLLE